MWLRENTCLMVTGKEIRGEKEELRKMEGPMRENMPLKVNQRIPAVTVLAGFPKLAPGVFSVPVAQSPIHHKAEGYFFDNHFP